MPRFRRRCICSRWEVTASGCGRPSCPSRIGQRWRRSGCTRFTCWERRERWKGRRAALPFSASMSLLIEGEQRLLDVVGVLGLLPLGGCAVEVEEHEGVCGRGLSEQRAIGREGEGSAVEDGASGR